MSNLVNVEKLSLRVLKGRGNLFFWLALLLFFIIGWTVYSYAATLPRQFLFNRQGALKEWKEKIFHGRVLYEIKSNEGDFGYLRAESQNAASGLFHNIGFSPRKYPYIRWKWKVDKFPALVSGGKNASDQKGWIERDDYALRVYVIFPSFIFTNTECLEYVWSEDLPQGTILTSPFFKNIKLIVVESGSQDIGKWRGEERDITKDYKRAFGKKLTRNVGAIALMTDADNSKSSALGYYADIKVGYAQSEEALLKVGESEEEKEEKETDLVSRFLEYVNSLARSLVHSFTR